MCVPINFSTDKPFEWLLNLYAILLTAIFIILVVAPIEDRTDTSLKQEWYRLRSHNTC